MSENHTKLAIGQSIIKLIIFQPYNPVTQHFILLRTFRVTAGGKNKHLYSRWEILATLPTYRSVSTRLEAREGLLSQNPYMLTYQACCQA